MLLGDMTLEDWQALSQYVYTIRNAMGLYAWAIHIEREPCKRKYQASVQPIYGRRIVQLYLCESWPTLPPSEQKQTIIHELLHIHFFDMQNALDRLESRIDDTLFQVTYDAHLMGLEYAIDTIAYALCNQFPDPPAISGNTQTMPDSFFLLPEETIIDIPLPEVDSVT